MQSIVGLVLGGGKGTRLLPLTQHRSKPAVPLAGKYRIIDIPISNCINSGINQIYVLTQFNSVSLHRHIRQTYQFDHFDHGFVEILAAQQTNEGADWYQGTADAVRKQLRYIEQPWIEHVLVLSGDQLYRMDYRAMLETHRREKADVTIAGVPVTREAARHFGIMRINETGRVVGFLEKPKTEQEFALVRSDPAWLDAHGVVSRGRDGLASMGIYLFNRKTLVDLLEKSDYQDFGKEVFPMSIRAGRCRSTRSTAIGKTSAPSAPSTRRTWRSPKFRRRSPSSRAPARSTRTPARCRRPALTGPPSANRSWPTAA